MSKCYAEVSIKGSVILEYLRENKNYRFWHLCMVDEKGNGGSIKMKDIKPNVYYGVTQEYNFFTLHPCITVDTLKDYNALNSKFI